MPRKFTLLSITAALGSVAIVLFMLALSASAAPAFMTATAPGGGLILEVNYSHDWVNAITTPLATVAITVTRSGAVIATITGQADAQGNFNSNQHEDGWSPSRPDLMPGDSVAGATSGASASVNPIGEIVGAIDLNTISGAIHAPALAPANLTVRCEVWVQDANVSPIVVPNVPANGGTYVCNFGLLGYHIAPGDNIAVSYYEPDGDRVIAVFRAPAPDPAVKIWTEGSSDVRAGGLAVFHVTYWNQGNMPAANVLLTDTLPAGASFVAATLGVAPVVASGHVTWNLGTVMPGGQIHFFVVLSNTSAPGASLHNAVDIGTSSRGDDPGNNHQEATVQVTSGLPDLNVGQQAQPNNPLPGDTYRISVDYGNNGQVPGGPVTLSVQLAPGTTLQDWVSENGYGSLWKLTSSAGGHLVFAAPALPGSWGDRLLLTVAVAATVPPNTKLESTVSISAPLDPNPGNNGPFSQQVWTAQDQQPDLKVEKSWSYGQLVQGGHAFYNLNYSNDGNLTQPSVRLTDTLPSGTTFVTSTVDLNWGDSVAAPPLYQNGGVVAWDLGALPPGHWGHLKVELALGGVQAGATITNTAEIRGLNADRSWWNNQAVAVDHVNGPGANLRLRKNSYWEGPGKVRFELQFENVGTTVVENVRITDTLPAELVFDGDWWKNGCCDLDMSFDPGTRQIVWTTGRLEPSWSGNIMFRAPVREDLTGQQGLMFTNTAQITLPPGEVTPADNSATAVAFTGPDLYIDKSLTAGNLVPGGLVTFTINLGNRNNGPWDTGNPPPGQPALYITDTLPAEMTFVSATDPYSPGDTWQPRQDGKALTWTMGGMCAGCQAQFQISARISNTAPGLTQLTNTIQIAAALPGVADPYPSNNRASWSGAVAPTYGVDLQPGTSAASGRPGTVVTHTLRLTNTGNAPATFDLGPGSHIWSVVCTQTQVDLAPGAWVDVPVRVTIPPLVALAQLQDTVTITATVRDDSSKQAAAVLTTRADIARLYLPLLRRH